MTVLYGQLVTQRVSVEQQQVSISLYHLHEARILKQRLPTTLRTDRGECSSLVRRLLLDISFCLSSLRNQTSARLTRRPPTSFPFQTSPSHLNLLPSPHIYSPFKPNFQQFNTPSFTFPSKLRPAVRKKQKLAKWRVWKHIKTIHYIYWSKTWIKCQQKVADDVQF